MVGSWIVLLTTRWDAVRERWQVLRDNPEAGYSTEAVVVTAALVALALAVIAILVTAVMDKANSIVL